MWEQEASTSHRAEDTTPDRSWWLCHRRRGSRSQADQGAAAVSVAGEGVGHGGVKGALAVLGGFAALDPPAWRWSSQFRKLVGDVAPREPAVVP